MQNNAKLVKVKKPPKYNPADVANVKETLTAQVRTYGQGLVRWVWNRLMLERKLRDKFEREKLRAERNLKDLETRFRSS